VEQIQLAQDRDHSRALVIAVMNPRFLTRRSFLCGRFQCQVYLTDSLRFGTVIWSNDFFRVPERDRDVHSFFEEILAFRLSNMCAYMTTTYCNVLGGSIHDGTLLHSKSQYTTVKHSQKLLEHTYTPDPHGLGTLTPIEFFQQDLLWQSSNTHSHSCSQKASIHTSGQSIVGLSVHLHTTTAPRRIVHQYPAIYQLRRSSVFTVHRINSRTPLTISRYELNLPTKRSP
jgi:hypothetical protein